MRQRFGDRFSGDSLRVHKRRWLRYWYHLAQAGFTKNDQVYQFFGAEVFHDGEVAFEKFDISLQLCRFTFRNVAAIDRLHARFGVSPKPGKFRSDFETAVRFEGVSLVEFECSTPTTQIRYHSCELDKKLNNYLMTIRLEGSAKRGPSSVWVKLKFEKARIENISAKINKYLPPGESLKGILTYISHDPIHYAKLIEDELKGMTL